MFCNAAADSVKKLSFNKHVELGMMGKHFLFTREQQVVACWNNFNCILMEISFKSSEKEFHYVDYVVPVATNECDGKELAEMKTANAS